MKKLMLIMGTALSLIACQHIEKESAPIKGADLGWMTEMEHDSVLFYNNQDESTDCLQLFAEAGMDAVRLRVWVNHKTGWSNLPDVLSASKRVKEAGLPLMIDLHYSDFFADPQRQDIPEAWKALNLHELCIAVAAHTTEVLEALKAEGIEPRWVQIGNETTYGMLWPVGQLNRDDVNEDAKRTTGMLSKETRMDWHQYAQLSNAGYDAAKTVFPEITCIIHVDNAFIPRANWFHRFRAEGGKWDMIGLSHYPFTQDTLSWNEMNALCEADVKELVREFDCPVMIVEIGVVSEWQPEESLACIEDFKTRMATIEGYAGVFYWEPEVYGGWRPAEYIPLGWGAYGMGCMTPDGHLSEAAKLLYK